MTVTALLCGAGERHEARVAQEQVRFVAYDVIVDPVGRPLGAYQVDFAAARPGDITIVGIEGGEHPAFAQPPFYDPKALMNERAVLAAFSTDAALPEGPTLVARVHVRITGDAVPDLTVALTVAAGPGGDRFETATVTTRLAAPEGDDS
ncbi:MAG: hypothetical protein AAFX05_05905 [Planctomycetota bacterium]